MDSEVGMWIIKWEVINFLLVVGSVIVRVRLLMREIWDGDVRFGFFE